ncbi:acyl--CoA ligase [Variovorax sp. ZS18.2.2]|uniref:class I adenylate-forming enzyme family protein n=1 Tax=Variovorax sp. ZS18.2.2 TaxID=2971255 RepID=UPI0021514F89|nr:class I adenylate-forming enzyme family protein [Variovorax sp. ZS18.2.2]MCR6477339.1 acyl--CoA ligase [Variovorax sp. ZS18.2.2]
MMVGFFHELFEAAALLDPGKTAIEVDGITATFAELARTELQVSRMLKHAGVLPGDRVGLSCAISPAAVASAFAVMREGCILATISHLCEEGQFIDLVADCGATVLVTDRSVDTSALSRQTAVRRWFHGGAGALLEAWRSADPQARSRCTDYVDAARPQGLDRPAAIFYSSGSTGKPKGVLVSHRNMTAAFHSVTGYLGTHRADRVLSFTAGLSSDYGFYNVTMPLLLGATAVVKSVLPARSEEVGAILRDEEITALQVFPPALLHMLEAEVLPPLPALRYISSSGDVLPVRHIERIRETYPEVRIFSNYGMTECKRIAYLAPEQLERRPGSVGKAIPGVQTLLFDQEGAVIEASHRIGELGVMGDLVMQGYWNQPELTAKVLKRNFVDGRSLFLTGDLFRMDEDGYLYFVGRKDDMLFRDGVMLNPRDVERELLCHPAVSEAMVLPVRGNDPSGFLCACLVLRIGCNVSEEELKAHCASNLKQREIPELFLFMEVLPRTFGGKASRREMAEHLCASGILGAKKI